MVPQTRNSTRKGRRRSLVAVFFAVPLGCAVTVTDTRVPVVYEKRPSGACEVATSRVAVASLFRVATATREIEYPVPGGALDSPEGTVPLKLTEVHVHHAASSALEQIVQLLAAGWVAVRTGVIP